MDNGAMNYNQPPKDHADGDRGAYDDPTGTFEQHVKSRDTWMRLVFMLLSCLLFFFAAVVGSFVVALQFFWVLFTGRTKAELKSVGRQLAEYFRQIVLYLSFDTDRRPFPFDRDWPSG
jgi:hypothetical protein